MYGNYADLAQVSTEGTEDGTPAALNNLLNKDYKNAVNNYFNAVTNSGGTGKDLSDEVNTATQDTNRYLQDYIDSNDTVLSGANLEDYIESNEAAYNDSLRDLRGLQNGLIPQAYQTAMQDAISSALRNTIGNTLNNLGQRGVINSSVTNSALNDIEKNAADAVAQNYLNNINTLQGLAQNLWQNQLTTNQENAQMTNQQFQNALNTSNVNAALTNQQFQNALTNATFASDLANQSFNNATNYTNTMLGGNNQWYNQQQSAINNRANLLNNWVGNQNTTNNANANIYSNAGIGQAGSRITTAAAAQEAAQQPAVNLWNSSIGLNGANTSALSAAAGKGTTTTSTDSGGGFFSGLFGGLF